MGIRFHGHIHANAHSSYRVSRFVIKPSLPPPLFLFSYSSSFFHFQGLPKYVVLEAFFLFVSLYFILFCMCMIWLQSIIFNVVEKGIIIASEGGIVYYIPTKNCGDFDVLLIFFLLCVALRYAATHQGQKVSVRLFATPETETLRAAVQMC